MKHYQKDKPKPVNEFCTQCGKQLNEYHLFFDKKKCSDCEPIYLLHKTQNNAIPTGTVKLNESLDSRQQIKD